jgi:hypothetical protein
MKSTIQRGAEFSVCGKYRYALWRIWDESKPRLLIIGLNPSIADDRKDSFTSARCMKFAQSWGYGALYIANLFAHCSQDPHALTKDADPVGPENDRWLIKLSQDASLVVAAWGSRGGYRGRDIAVLRLLRRVHCLGVTRRGKPRHPRSVRRDAEPRMYLVDTGGQWRGGLVAETSPHAQKNALRGSRAFDYVNGQARGSSRRG